MNTNEMLRQRNKSLRCCLIQSLLFELFKKLKNLYLYLNYLGDDIEYIISYPN